MRQPRSRATSSSAGLGLVYQRIVGTLQQGKVVGGVAVEADATEIAQLPAHAGQPLFHAWLPSPEGRHAIDFR